jgi:predicted dehydrogenase
MSSAVCRWGIVGTANIARKNWKAFKCAGNAALVAVASRDRERARRFIDECQADVPMVPAPTPCASYEELLGRRDVDAVYVPLPTGVRKEWVLRAATAGKHVLCEKPCGVTSADVREMLDACRRSGVQFMDGVMFLHSGRLPLLRQVLDDGQSVGTVRRISSQFSFKATGDFLTKNIRVSGDLEPLGCLGDLGWYNIRFTLWALKEQLPERVTGCILGQHDRGDGGPPVPTEFSGELFFAGGVSASFYCSFVTENQQWAHVSGTLGYLEVPDFVLPFFGSEVAFEANAPRFRLQGGDFNMESHPRRFAVHEYSNGAANSQEANMIRTFSRIATSGRLEASWGDNVLKTQQVLDACLQSARAGGKQVDLSPQLRQ